MVDFACQVSAANMALDWLQTKAITNSSMRPHVTLLVATQADICNALVAAKGWNWDQLIECLGDIGRAAALAHPAGRA